MLRTTHPLRRRLPAHRTPRAAPPPDLDAEKTPDRGTATCAHYLASKQRRRGRSALRGCLIVAVALGGLGVMALLGLLALGALLEDAGLGATTGGQIQEYVIEGDPTATKTIAVIDVKGVILRASGMEVANPDQIVQLLRQAASRTDVVAVVLDMDSPGGEVTAADEIWNAVRNLREHHKIPVVTCMHSLGASGGYYIAAGTDHIVANRHTMTGSIGVLAQAINYSALIDRFGVDVETYRSGDMKDMLNGSRVRGEKEKRYMQALIDRTFSEFARIVAEGRTAYHTAQDVVNADFGDGRVLDGEQAWAAGLVDQIGYFGDAVDKARELGDAPFAKVVRFHTPSGFLDLLMSLQTDRGGIEGMVRGKAPVVEPGRLYYLMPAAAR